jgi:D-erythronate 2-dehydrogenase
VKTVLVTGAGGFIGQRVVAQLAQSPDWRVVALDRHLPPMTDPTLRHVEGDLADVAVRAAAFAEGVHALVHLAAVPGGAAEADPAASRRINLDVTLDLFGEFAAVTPGGRVVYASTIAVYGDDLPVAGVDGSTPPRPVLVYGAHKAMVETMLETYTRRGQLDGVALRIPGVVARPMGGVGLKSAFLSEVFHAMRARRSFVCPVSPDATLWLTSVDQVAQNLVYALTVPAASFEATERTLLLPAVHTRMVDLVDAVARATGAARESVTYAPDAMLERGFGCYPALQTPTAESLGFRHDGSLDNLVARVLSA